MTELDDRLREHYRAHSLPNDFMDELLENPEGGEEEVTPNVPWWRETMAKLQANSLQVGIAACLLVLASATVHNFGVHAERTERALKEVALNHTTRFELEFENDSIAKIDDQMTLLPFDITLPEPLAEKYQVEGARYCSLSGQLAAHVKLIDRISDKPVSVFMTRASDELGVIDNSEEHVDGVNVRIWRESGLLYAMVGSHQGKQ